MLLQVLPFRLAVPPQVVQRVCLSRPLAMAILAKAIEQGKQAAGRIQGRERFVPRRIAAHADEHYRGLELRLLHAIDDDAQHVRPDAPWQRIKRQLDHSPVCVLFEAAFANRNIPLSQRDRLAHQFLRPSDLDDHRLVRFFVQQGGDDLPRRIVGTSQRRHKN
jgi:hypothetical protein